MWASGIVLKRSRSALAAFSTNRRGVSGLFSDLAAAAASSPSFSGPFLYNNQRRQVLHISQFVEANGKRAFMVRRMETQGVPSKQAEAINEVITEVLNDSLVNFVSKGEMQKFVEANGKGAFLVDTLALVRRMEAQGVPSKHAEAIMSAITEVLNDSLKNVVQLFVSKGEMRKSEMIHDANLSKLQSQVQSSQNPLVRELEKVRGDFKEKFNASWSELEAATYDFKKSCIGAIVSTSVVGLATCSYYDAKQKQFIL